MNSIDVATWLKTQNELRAFVYKKVKDKSLAEDIVQDVFLKVSTHIESLKDSEKITSWIYQITRNVIMDHFRREAKSINSIDLDWESESANYNECVSLCLKEMLQQLPAKYREAIELTEFENLSQIQLAERLQISYSGAKSRVQRARQILRAKMDETYHIRLDAYGNAITCKNRVPCGCN
jgi:RNA polymerase sigma-70 factor (ECF subfamily)